jgi:hypothetical protein
VVSPRFLARLLAILSIWSVVVGLGTGLFFAPRGSEAQPTDHDLIGFGCSMAIASVVAAMVAVGMVGKRRWAVEIALAVALLIVVSVPIAYVLLWVDPWTLRNRMDAWSFLRLRRDVPRWGEAIVTFHAPMAAGVASIVGAIAARMIRLARRRPRPATTITLVLLFACAWEPVQQLIFGLVIIFGHIIRRGWYIGARLDPWPMTDEQIWATAALFGAIAGALVAGLALHLAGRHRSDLVAPGRGTSPEGAGNV